MIKEYLLTYNWGNKAWSDKTYLPVIGHVHRVREERGISDIHVYDIANDGTLTELGVFEIGKTLVLFDRKAGCIVEFCQYKPGKETDLDRFFREYLEYMTEV